MKDKIKGSLIGLAVGDAYGTTYEFTPRDQMPNPLHNGLIGGGPFKLEAGSFTDDTSMALCLLESLNEKGWDIQDQMSRYVKWWQEGYMSVNGKCFDIGRSTMEALGWWNMTGGQFIENKDFAGNGTLMRLAPVVMKYHDDLEQTLRYCAEQSVMTHPSPQSIICSMFLGLILYRIFNGEERKEYVLDYPLDFVTSEDKDYLAFANLLNEYEIEINVISHINRMMRGVYLPQSGDGYCTTSLEAALWAFSTTETFEDGLKKVVSLGEDTDTTGAIYGQIAGAFYGYDAIPWKGQLLWHDKMVEMIEQVYI